MTRSFHPERAPLVSAIREVVERPGPGLILLYGRRGSGISTLLDAAVGKANLVRFPLPALADPDQRALLRQRLASTWPTTADELREVLPRTSALRAPTAVPPDPAEGPWDWDWLVASLAARHPEGGAAPVLVLEDLEHVSIRRDRFAQGLAAGWEEVRRRSSRAVLILATRDPQVFGELTDPESVLEPLQDRQLELAPLTLRGVSEALSGWAPEDRLRAWSVLGGSPGRLSLLERGRSLGWNLRRLLLDPAGPLHREMEDHLVRNELNQPGRYGTLLRTVALGGNTWGRIREAFPGERGSGRPGPYAQRLVDLGLLAVEQSLDAGPRSRSRRYHVVDPLQAAWYQLVLPHLPDLRLGRRRDVWRDQVEPRLPGLTAARLPTGVREILERGVEISAESSAREVGALWGPGYDIPVAGVLRNAAAFYSLTAGPGRRFSPLDLEGLDRAIRETRYGFGRERRVRLLVSWDPVSDEMESEVARRDLTRVLDQEFLLGE
jgi:hypothetical protein